MKRLLYSALAATMAILIAGCTKEDMNVVTPTSDCYISSVVLGTMRRTVTSGDTEYETTFAGSTYGISIDQVAGIITNITALPTRTNLSIVPVTITAKGSVVFAPKPEDYPDVQPDGWYTYTTSGGTIDFRSPVLFRAYATDGKGYREYEMTLTVREHEEGSYTWEELESTALQGRGARQAQPWQEGLLLLSADGEGKLHKTTFANGTWGADVLCTGTDDADVKSLMSFKDKLWMHTATGAVIYSEDGETWNTTEQLNDYEVTLLAASEEQLYARIHSASSTPSDWVASSPNGTAWTEIPIESGKDISQFPTTATGLSFKIGTTPYVLVAGEGNDNLASVWVRHEQENESWALMEPEEEVLALKWLNGMTLVRYNNSIICLCGSQTETYYSPDNGLTWRTLKELVLPVTNANFAATAQGDYIYVFAGESIQRAKVN